MYKLREERDIKPATFSAMISSMLYSRRYVNTKDKPVPLGLSTPCYSLTYIACVSHARFAPWFVEPVVAGLDAKGKPYIWAADLLGCGLSTSDFVVSGTCTENMMGMCESLFKKDLVRPASAKMIAGVSPAPCVVLTSRMWCLHTALCNRSRMSCLRCSHNH